LLELGAGFHQELTGRENVYLNASILGLTKKETDAVFDSIDPHDWAFTDWVWGPTALVPGDEPPLYRPVPLDGALPGGRDPDPVAATA
jgi:hypothetical protein